MSVEKLPRGAFECIPAPQTTRGSLAADLVLEMRELRKAAADWLLQPEQRRLLRHEPDCCPTFANYAARRLDSLPREIKVRLREEAGAAAARAAGQRQPSGPR